MESTAFKSEENPDFHGFIKETMAEEINSIARKKQYEMNFKAVYQQPLETVIPHHMIFFTIGASAIEIFLIGSIVFLCYVITPWKEWMQTWNGFIVLSLVFPTFGLTISFFYLQVLKKLFIVVFTLKSNRPRPLAWTSSLLLFMGALISCGGPFKCHYFLLAGCQLGLHVPGGLVPPARLSRPLLFVRTLSSFQN